jgi:7-cyano-7-deazaguanine synthase
MRRRAIVLLSGGVDSATCLFWAKEQGYALTGLSFNYHLRPEQERQAASRLAQRAGAQLIEVPLPFLKELCDLRAEGLGPQEEQVPEGYVPARNLIFYAVATYYAEVAQADLVVGGHLAVDPESFPDASPGFFRSFESLANLALLRQRPPLEFAFPFSAMSKAEVIEEARKLGVPIELTWSCYGDGAAPCGQCISCLERAEALGG